MRKKTQMVKSYKELVKDKLNKEAMYFMNLTDQKHLFTESCWLVLACYMI